MAVGANGKMTGAEAVIRTAAAAGIEACFANPGTTELFLVKALDNCPSIRSVLAVFEGVCTGAADGYARISGKPGLTLLHLGPGFANGIANLHNARKAHTPIVSIIGEHATWHIAANAPLTSDIATLARPMSTWVHTTSTADAASVDMAAAIAQATHLPGGPVALILPGDIQWAETTKEIVKPSIPSPPQPDVAETERAAHTLRTGASSAALVLSGSALRARGLRAAERIVRATGCRGSSHRRFPPYKIVAQGSSRQTRFHTPLNLHGKCWDHIRPLSLLARANQWHFLGILTSAAVYARTGQQSFTFVASPSIRQRRSTCWQTRSAHRQRKKFQSHRDQKRHAARLRQSPCAKLSRQPNMKT